MTAKQTFQYFISGLGRPSFLFEQGEPLTDDPCLLGGHRLVLVRIGRGRDSDGLAHTFRLRPTPASRKVCQHARG
jgi:hypothetical protein